MFNKYDSHDLGIGDLSIGVDSKGMAQYISDLKAEILKTVGTAIDDVNDVTTAINSCWQGKSKETFLKDFAKTRELIKDDLEKEYKDLKARLQELESFYFEQDQKMMGEGE